MPFPSFSARFVWLLGVYDERTVRVEIPAVETARTFVIGPKRKPPPDCPCELHWADEECIGQTLDPALMGRCWDRLDLIRGRRTLRNSYMLLTGGFGAVIGLLLLMEGVRQAESAAKQANAKKGKPKSKKKSPAPPD